MSVMLGRHGRPLGRGGRPISRGIPVPIVVPPLVGAPPGFIGRHLGIVAPTTSYSQVRIDALKTAQPLFDTIRVPFFWDDMQPTEGGPINFGAQITTRMNSGLKPIVALFRSPAWNRSVPGDGWSPPTDLTSYATMVTATANWVKNNHPTVHWWEIWNEPNHQPFWPAPDAVNDGPEVYYGLLKTAYKAIKTVDPLAIVCTGGLSPYTGPANLQPDVWLNRLLDECEARKGSYSKPAAGWSDTYPVDRFGIHPYINGRPVNPGPYNDITKNVLYNTFARAMPLMAQTAAAHGLPVLPFWATEMGLYHFPEATTNQGWNGGPFGAQNKNVASELEAADWWDTTLGCWYGTLPFPTGSNLVAFPTSWGLPTEILTAFHLRDFPSGGAADLHGEASGFYKSDGTQKRDTGRDAWEAFTGFTARPFGVGVPIAGFSKVTEFQTNTVPLEIVRCYPGGAVLEASLNQTRNAITQFPGRSICYNSKTAGRGYTDAQLTSFVQAIEVEAAKVPQFFLVPDAEPDRTDRTYTDAQFLATFNKLADLVTLYAPHVTISLNLTGYQFTTRIGRYDSIRGRYSILSLDPYWTASPNGVQGTLNDLNAAASWCGTYGKDMALAEWGAEIGAGQVTRLNSAFTWINAHPIRFSCMYIDDDPSVPIKTALTTGDCFTAYKAGVTP